MSPFMLIHVIAGAVAVLAGFTALFAPKGAPWHRAAGNTFTLTMLISAAAGAWIAFSKPEMITFLAGALTCYLVATSWATVRQAPNQADAFGVLALLAAAGISIAGFSFGAETLTSESGLKHGYSAEPYFFFAILALLATALDASVLWRRGIAGAQRIARHLWRMCFALFIAAGSLFTGPGAGIFPEQLQGNVLLSLPELIVLLLMLFWLLRVLFTKWSKERAALALRL